MVDKTNPPNTEKIHALLELLTPGSTLLAIEPLPGSYSNYTHLVVARSADGSEFHLVVRRYQVFGLYWRLIGPFSGLIRRELLRLVKTHAELAITDP